MSELPITEAPDLNNWHSILVFHLTTYFFLAIWIRNFLFQVMSYTFLNQCVLKFIMYMSSDTAVKGINGKADFMQ